MENMKQCRDCGQAVSTKAKTCPNCGAPKPAKASKKGCLWYIGAFFVVVLIIGVVSSLFEDNGESPASSEASIPEYVVADRVGNYGDIVAPSLSLSTPREELATVANAIGVREGLDELSLYCSQDAVRANFSQSFLEANPRAYDCVLGSWEDGVFTLTSR
jgi:hypothetical protein